MKVLFATDGSEYAQAAIDSMLARPWPDKTDILVVHVVQVIPPSYIGYYGGYMDALAFADESGKRFGEGILQKATAQLKKGLPDVSVNSVLTVGSSPSDEIVEEAKRWKADMIVVGSHGRTGLAKFFMGSVAEAVLHKAPCSVEVVRRPKTTKKAALESKESAAAS
ncbi:MAG: universal stress protein [Candidatus Obscuribacterales bacterium]